MKANITIDKNSIDFVLAYKKDTCFLLVSDNICFFIMLDKTIKAIKISLWKIQDYNDFMEGYIKINRNVIINSYYYVKVIDKKKRLILMRSGNILKVSRSNWDKFK